MLSPAARESAAPTGMFLPALPMRAEKLARLRVLFENDEYEPDAADLAHALVDGTLDGRCRMAGGLPQ